MERLNQTPLLQRRHLSAANQLCQLDHKLDFPNATITKLDVVLCVHTGP